MNSKRLQGYRELAEKMNIVVKLRSSSNDTSLNAEAILDLLARLEIAEEALKVYADDSAWGQSEYADDEGMSWENVDGPDPAKKALTKINSEEPVV